MTNRLRRLRSTTPDGSCGAYHESQPNQDHRDGRLQEEQPDERDHRAADVEEERRAGVGDEQDEADGTGHGENRPGGRDDPPEPTHPLLSGPQLRDSHVQATGADGLERGDLGQGEHREPAREGQGGVDGGDALLRSREGGR